MSGMRDLGNLAHLQVVGKSQITKELEEMQGLENKHIDVGALHRNEQTKEVEADGGYDESL